MHDFVADKEEQTAEAAGADLVNVNDVQGADNGRWGPPKAKIEKMDSNKNKKRTGSQRMGRNRK